MRHRVAGRKFGRDKSSRRAMFRALAGALILHERIRTTDAKAKELRRVVERLITRARRLGEVAEADAKDLSPEDRARRLHARRVAARFLPRFGEKANEEGDQEEVDLLEKLFTDLGPRFRDRDGGYTRIVKVGPRRGDGAPISIIELVGSEGAEEAADEDEEETEMAKGKKAKKGAAKGAKKAPAKKAPAKKAPAKKAPAKKAPAAKRAPAAKKPAPVKAPAPKKAPPAPAPAPKKAPMSDEEE